MFFVFLESGSNFFESYRMEIGIGVALVTILVIGKFFFGSTKKEDASKKQQKDSKSGEDVEETKVANVSDLKEGEIKEVEVSEGKIVLVKQNDEFFAISNKCSHLGAPLKNGALGEGRIRCPWHGACFNLKSGDIEDYPCVDAIKAFETRVEGENVMVKVPKGSLKSHKRTPKMVSKSDKDERVFAIIGGGPAGLVCAETLRQEGFQGNIVLISNENYLPYDRTKLSKAMNVAVEQILLRPKEFFDEHGIELKLGFEVTELNTATKTITFSNGETLKYDAVTVATGGNPRKLPVPGMDLQNIFQLRVPEDSRSIINNIEGKKVVIVGTSFIGMEAAACVVQKAASVVAIGMEKVPFERVLGAEIGTVFQKLHEEKGVQFRLQRVVKEFRGSEKVNEVVLDDGEVLEADICIIGAGIIPATDFIKSEDIEIFRDRSVVVDKFLKATEGVYAVGDIARYPFHLTGETIRVEHYGMAHYHGRIAAYNMLNRRVPVESVPFFWTSQYGKNLRYAGHALSYDKVFVDGNLDSWKFVAYYIKGDKVVAVATVGRDPVASKIAELMAQRKMPSAQEVESGSFKL